MQTISARRAQEKEGKKNSVGAIRACQSTVPKERGFTACSKGGGGTNRETGGEDERGSEKRLGSDFKTGDMRKRVKEKA